MDQYGIGNALRGAALAYFQGARRTGRTTKLIERVRDGDRIVFATREEAARVQQLLRERGVRPECIVVPVDQPHRAVERISRSTRVLFDHCWIEQYHLRSIERASAYLGTLAREGDPTQAEASALDLLRRRMGPPFA